MTRRSVALGAAVAAAVATAPAAGATALTTSAAVKAHVTVRLTSARVVAGGATEADVTNLTRRTSTDLLLAGKRITILHSSAAGKAQARVVVPKKTGRFTLAVRQSGHILTSTTVTVIAAPTRTTPIPPAGGGASTGTTVTPAPSPTSTAPPVSVPPAPVLTGTGTWLGEGHDPGHTEDGDPGSPITAANVSSLVPAWTAVPGGGDEADPVVYDGMAIFGSYTNKFGGVEAVDEETGAVVWNTLFGYAANVDITPVIDPQRGLVYVPYNDVRNPAQTNQSTGVSIVAYRLSDGQQVWRHDDNANHIGEPGSLPLQVWAMLETSTGLVYSDDEAFQESLDPDTGTPQWQRIPTNLEDAQIGSINANAYGDGDLLETTPDGIEVDDPATGQPRWTMPDTGFTVPPIIADGRIYLASGGASSIAPYGTVEAFNAAGCGSATCKPIWTTTVATPIDNGLAYQNGQLYAVGNISPYAHDPAGDPPDELYALDADTGTVEWSAAAPVPGSPVGRDVTVSGNLVVVTGTENEAITAYTADGCGQATCSAVSTLTLPSRTVGLEPAEIVGDRLLTGGLDTHAYRLP